MGMALIFIGIIIIVGIVFVVFAFVGESDSSEDKKDEPLFKPKYGKKK